MQIADCEMLTFYLAQCTRATAKEREGGMEKYVYTWQLVVWHKKRTEHFRCTTYK